MMHKYCFEHLNKTLRVIIWFKYVLGSKLPFQSKTNIFGGNFKHILPIITREIMQELMNGKILLIFGGICNILKKKMMFRKMNSKSQANELQKFSNWVAVVGDNMIGGANDEHENIDVLGDIYLKFYDDPIDVLVGNISIVDACSG